MKPITWHRALVTGASTGIGKAMAQELARQGTALVLVARNVERLEKLAASMDVPVEVLPADLTDPGQLDLVARRCAATDEPVDLLVNNAGIWSFGALTGPDGDGADAMVALNVGAVVALSRSAARQMTRSRARHDPQHLLHRRIAAVSLRGRVRRFQGICHLVRPEPARGVAGDRRGVTTVTPGLTRSELHFRAGHQRQVSRAPGWLWMEAEQVAALTLRAAAARAGGLLAGAGLPPVVAGR